MPDHASPTAHKLIRQWGLQKMGDALVSLVTIGPMSVVSETVLLFRTVTRSSEVLDYVSASLDLRGRVLSAFNR